MENIFEVKNHNEDTVWTNNQDLVQKDAEMELKSLEILNEEMYDFLREPIDLQFIDRLAQQNYEIFYYTKNKDVPYSYLGRMLPNMESLAYLSNFTNPLEKFVEKAGDLVIHLDYKAYEIEEHCWDLKMKFIKYLYKKNKD